MIAQSIDCIGIMSPRGRVTYSFSVPRPEGDFQWEEIHYLQAGTIDIDPEWIPSEWIPKEFRGFGPSEVRMDGIESDPAFGVIDVL